MSDRSSADKEIALFCVIVVLKKTQSWAYAPIARSFMVAAEDACLRFWSNQLLDVQFGGKACTDQDANVVHDDVRHG